MKWTYLLVDLCAVLVPFLFSFHSKIRFDRHFKPYLLANAISASIFLIWDSLFVSRGVWGFSEKYTIGPHFFNLPIEEILFFICIPFSCVFTYHCFSRFLNVRWKEQTTVVITMLIASLILVVGIIFSDRAYTGMTFISTGILLLMMKFVFNVQWLPLAMVTYLVLLIPFFIVNGILTGTGLEEPVVWYNDEENLGIRLLTIPIEDVVYGFELFVLTVFGYERFKPFFKR